ncbi:hypothetical protein GCM10012320_10220 [Sinomonas cellulolyticus]|uniref:MarR family transcriptional regulator n=1 Tax=Sinomonas cellulolyticus TaxID=2801916 RepID=A0ABS1K4N3_9MICC|nr:MULTISPECIES: MarR family transcriptional regulator [Sinomonas]MBL0706478.1 MarR family transcriptional regulator [Sinomonas cellulolyticus]GHG44843.1 hypothetical protein GCM10012320_10220 [Sinomonas sp. KCTC 49339]
MDAHESGPGDAWGLTDVITRLRRSLRAGVRDELPWESLPMAQVELLQRLADEPGLTVSELAQRQSLAKNTVSNLVQQMVLSGLLERESSTTDRRAFLLHLTREGMDRLHHWRTANERRIRRAFVALEPADQDVINRALPALQALAAKMEGEEGSRGV